MFRHGSLRDERRRRSLLEEATAAGDASTTTKSRRVKTAEAYAERAHSDFHARWSDFVPRRHRWLAAIFAAGMAPIVALHAGYYATLDLAIWRQGGIPVLDLARSDSMAGWLAAIITFLTAVLAVFIYSVRRYKLDDYRGRYRLWLWSAGLWMAMSVDAVADLRSVIKLLAVEASGWVGPLNGDVWWLGPLALYLAWCAIRMVFEMRGCRTALASLIIAIASIASGCALSQAELPLSGAAATMVLSACSLVGSWMLLFAHLSFARHVLLDAHGQLPIRPPKPKREKTPAAASDDKSKPPAKSAGTQRQRDDLTTRIDPPHAGLHRPAGSGGALPAAAASGSGSKSHLSASQPLPKSALSATAKPASSSTQFIGAYHDEDGPDMKSNKMSRAERKKLRKQQRGRFDDDE